MPGTFAYTESTNTVVVTGGTSGSPADFASFVTADRAGTDTDLLVAASPGSAVALTYAVRPIEDLAIKVKCIVANKTAEADFIFITGTDWRGAAQTESIDVTAGNGSYTTTKYWASITTLDCSDNANGGGTVWADGDLSVTQDVWGVIWDYGNGQYRIDAVFNIGNNSTTTYFTSKNESVLFNSSYFLVQTNTTLTLGELSGSWSINGSSWTINDSSDRTLMDNGGTLNIYGSRLKNVSSNRHKFEDGAITILNSIISGAYSTAGGNSNFWFHNNLSSVTFKNVYFDNMKTLLIYKTGTYENIRMHRSGLNINNTSIVLRNLIISSPEEYDISSGDGYNVTVIDSEFTEPPTLRIYGATNTISDDKTINIHVVDKDGANLSGATVACEDTNTDAAFTTQTTAADGTITEQTITSRQWLGTSETLTTYSPHKFTISKAGYKTLVLENITVDGPIDWHLTLDNPLGAFAQPFVR